MLKTGHEFLHFFSCSARKFDFIASLFSDILSSSPVSEKWTSDIFSHIAREFLKSDNRVQKGSTAGTEKSFIYTPVIPQMQN